MKRQKMFYFAVLFILTFMMGCSSAPKVTRVETKKQIDLSGGWNDYDAQLAAEEMIKDCLQRPWLESFYKSNGKNPTVIVGHVVNSTSEHINTGVFTKYLERELLNSGKVGFAASPEEREQIRTEREDQQKGYTSPETMAKLGREMGAHYMLIGSLNSIKDEIKGKFVILYQVNLELINLENNTKVWIGQKDIKKYVEQSRLSL